MRRRRLLRRSPPNPRPRQSLRLPLATTLLLLAACDDYIACTPVLKTDNGQLELQDLEAVVRGACGRMREPAPLLVGTRWCPVLMCSEDQPGCVIDEESGERLATDDVAACFDYTVEGATPDAECLRVDAAGELRWTFAPIDCPALELGFQPGPDALVLPIVDTAEVFAHLDVPGDAFARRSLTDADGKPLPTALQLSPGAVAYVLADQPVELAAVLTHPDLGDVGWNPSGFTLHAAVDDAERTIELDAMGVVSVTLAADEHMELWLERDAETLALGEVEGVAEDELTGLEVIAGFTGNEDDPGIPFGARAVARAGERIVYGVPVDWAVTEGVLPLWRDPERPWGPDYIALVDEDGLRCHAPPEKERKRFRARVRATYETLESEATLEWIEDPEEDGSLGEQVAEFFKGDGAKRSPLCEGPGFAEEGCGCRSGGNSYFGALALLLLGIGRRRRRTVSHRARNGLAAPG
jgi:MYXO-CTERM domain-containing protein